MSPSDRKYWFKRKRYGYGWTPATKEGWFSLVGLIVVMIVTGVALLKDVPEDTYQAEVGYFILLINIETLLFFWLLRNRAPKPKWRWGKSDTDNSHEDI